MRPILAVLVAFAVVVPYLHSQGFAPTEAASRMKPADGLVVKLFAAEPDVRQPIFVKCDDRGRVWTIQYLQYPNPAGLKRVKVDRWSRTDYDRVPKPPPLGPKGDDRITICEDTDGDGRADHFQDFVTGLNLCTGVEFGHGGVFVLQVPYLLFYPDRNRDDVPDDAPEVLLTGFGMQDAQSLANHLTWGPDGWLYGLNGSTTTCNVRGIEFQQGVWRYHPVTKAFELFCEGGGNVFGLTFDDAGRLLYSSNLGLFWHAHPGAYYFKSFGKHGPLHNPYAYGWLDHVAHDAPTGGPTTGGTIYRGHTFPERFRGRFLAGDFLRHTTSSWELRSVGATVSAQARELLFDSRDTWFGATDLCLGPDGSVYVSDFHDKRTAHPDPDADWDRSNGRIFQVRAEGTKPVEPFDLAKLSSRELVELLKHPNGWQSDRARVLLAERRDPATWPALRHMALRRDDMRLSLRSLWALHVSGGFDYDTAAEELTHPGEHVRAWTIRLLGEDGNVPDRLAARLAEMAASDPSPVVRAQLACTAKQLPGRKAWPVIEALLLRNEDAADPVIPWLVWWAVESRAIVDRDTVVGFFADVGHRARPLVAANFGRVVRRQAADGSAAGYHAALRLVTSASEGERPVVLADLDRGLAERAIGTAGVTQGGLLDNLAVPQVAPAETRRYEPLTPELAAWIRAVWETRPIAIIPTRLAMRADVAAARARVRADVASLDTPKALLLERLAVLTELGTEACRPAVLPLLARRDADIQQAALFVLGRVGGADVGEAVLRAYPTMSAAVQSKARGVLFGRKEWAAAFLRDVAANRIAAVSVPLDQVRFLPLLGDAGIDATVRKLWGNVSPGTPDEKLAEVRRFSNDLRAGTGDQARGKAVFQKQCGTCHKLFGEGGAVGPDLTSTSRADAAWLLASIVDPSAVVRSQYLQYALATTDGAVHSGIIVDQDGASITLADAKAERIRVPRDRIDVLRELPLSLMPEKLLDTISPQERRDLFRYLQQPGM